MHTKIGSQNHPIFAPSVFPTHTEAQASSPKSPRKDPLSNRKRNRGKGGRLRSATHLEALRKRSWIRALDEGRIRVSGEVWREGHSMKQSLRTRRKFERGMESETIRVAEMAKFSAGNCCRKFPSRICPIKRKIKFLPDCCNCPKWWSHRRNPCQQWTRASPIGRRMWGN